MFLRRFRIVVKSDMTNPTDWQPCRRVQKIPTRSPLDVVHIASFSLASVPETHGAARMLQ
jgi:hypothetical protein